MKVSPLDLVRTPNGAVALVTEVSKNGDASISYLTGEYRGEKNAWWSPNEGLMVLDSIPALLARNLAHPMGDNRDQDRRFFIRK